MIFALTLQCCIDLKNNVLHIGTTGTETPFLAESDLPMTDRLAFSDAEGEQMAQDRQLTEMEDKELAEAMAQSASDASQGSSSSSSSATGMAGSLSGSGTANFPEASIQKIVDLGFTRDQAILELQRTNGNVDVASAALIARSFSNMPLQAKR